MHASYAHGTRSEHTQRALDSRSLQVTSTGRASAATARGLCALHPAPIRLPLMTEIDRASIEVRDVSLPEASVNGGVSYVFVSRCNRFRTTRERRGGFGRSFEN
jgi:hypothetical protein